MQDRIEFSGLTAMSSSQSLIVEAAAAMRALATVLSVLLLVESGQRGLDARY